MMYCDKSRPIISESFSRNSYLANSTFSEGSYVMRPDCKDKTLQLLTIGKSGSDRGPLLRFKITSDGISSPKVLSDGNFKISATFNSSVVVLSDFSIYNNALSSIYSYNIVEDETESLTGFTWVGNVDQALLFYPEDNDYKIKLAKLNFGSGCLLITEDTQVNLTPMGVNKG